MIKKIFIHPTYRCNAECIHCAVPKSRKNILLHDFKRIVDVSKKNSVEYIIIGGGEPMLHPAIMSMIRYVHSKGIKVKVETNGSLLNKGILDELKKYVFQLNISLDGLKPKTHNSIRKINAFNKIIKNIEYARNIGIDVAIWSVVMKDNVKEMENIYKILERIGVNKISFLYATPVGRCFQNKDQILLDKERYYQFIKTTMSKKGKIQVRIGPYLIPFNKVNEFKGRFNSKIKKRSCMIYDKKIIHIDPEGNIFPCVLLLSNRKFCLGNTKGNDDLNYILKGNKGKWKNIMNILYEHKKYAENYNYDDQGCIGLCNEFKTNIDPRLKEGWVICPCRTINNEWNF